MNFLSRGLAAAIVVALTGCGLGGTLVVDPFLDQKISGEDFNAYLARAYQHRTSVEKYVDREWVHAGRFARKGYAALRGAAVLPWDPADWNVRPADRPELYAARARLLSALDNGGRSKFPRACAKAQVSYDGWLERANDINFADGIEGAKQPDYASAEKAAFYRVMPFCEGVIEPNKFVIYFGWGKLNLTAAALETVARIAKVTKEFHVANVTLEGHTDTSGSARANILMSEKRVRAVARALKLEGVVVTGAHWFGEEQPAVPTADNVREPLNRRVKVILSR